jgi:hypothetical protein
LETSIFSLREGSVTEGTGFTRPNDVATSDTYSIVLYQAHPFDDQSFQREPLSGLSILLQFIPAETGFTVSMNDTINYDNSSSLSQAHQHDNQL